MWGDGLRCESAGCAKAHRIEELFFRLGNHAGG